MHALTHLSYVPPTFLLYPLFSQSSLPQPPQLPTWRAASPINFTPFLKYPLWRCVRWPSPKYPTPSSTTEPIHSLCLEVQHSHTTSLSFVPAKERVQPGSICALNHAVLSVCLSSPPAEGFADKSLHAGFRLSSLPSNCLAWFVNSAPRSRLRAGDVGEYHVLQGILAWHCEFLVSWTYNLSFARKRWNPTMNKCVHTLYD